MQQVFGFFRVSNLGGGALIAIRHVNSHVVDGASSCIEPAGDGNGSCVSLDVKVLFLIATCKQSTDGQTDALQRFFLFFHQYAYDFNISELTSPPKAFLHSKCQKKRKALKKIDLSPLHGSIHHSKTFDQPLVYRHC